MRNLKKILAMALALIMSLSLMVTASAKTNFSDQGSINPNFATAIAVLNELDVLNGYAEGDYRPTNEITRAEVAAILYRIFTGDVGTPQTDNSKAYASSGPFADVDPNSWYAGYINYAYISGSIKGSPDITGTKRLAEAGRPVTGYEVLAMILRAVGYDKNNEFVGTEWTINTANTATQEGVLVNYLKTDAKLSANATREQVAELIFQSILLPKVTFDIVSQSYTKNSASDTIAIEKLGLEKIEGVVIANEWANLYGKDVITKNTTRIRLADESERTLNVGSSITDIGESRYAYVQNGGSVLAPLEDTLKNNVKDYQQGPERAERRGLRQRCRQ